ncbi:MAG: hypothetical protein GY822_13960 [Deltaproteobacteria bacterium]|nr:hypothetical protein [Deltaproteobacteria bacterium]
MTHRIYHDDASLLSFHSTIKQWSRTTSGVVVVILEESAFYPESGGQMADHGSIDGFEVVDVQLGQEQEIEHHLKCDVQWEIGTKVQGQISGTRRRQHRLLHTGQHLLSQAALKTLGAKTISSRLGETGCTLDLDIDSISEDEVSQLLDVVHDVIDEHRPIRCYFPDEETLRALELRRSSKVDKNIRVVDVEGYDVTPCGGTHCENTAEVGLVHVFRVERIRQNVRLCFDAGARARARLLQNHHWMSQLVEPLNASDAGIVDAVMRIRREADAHKKEILQLEKRWAKAVTDKMEIENGWAILVVKEANAQALLLLSQGILLETDAHTLCLFSPSETHGQLLLRSRGDVDCRQILKCITEEFGGNGGGKPEQAQGKTPANLPFSSLMKRIQQERQ